MAYQDLQWNSDVSITFSEMAIDDGTAPGCKSATGESPSCARLTLTGRLTEVPEMYSSDALDYLFSRHPEMKTWANNETKYKPFWMAPQDVDGYSLISDSKPVDISSAKWFAARWFRGGPVPSPVPGPWRCGVCGHVYDPEQDGSGKAFEDLHALWRCPVCLAPKSDYRRVIATDGSVQWIHDHDSEIV